MFPRINSALSAYLKNPRYRTRASLTLAVAAAAAGAGTASATMGAGPWAGSLHAMAAAGHGTSRAPHATLAAAHKSAARAGQSSARHAGASHRSSSTPYRIYDSVTPTAIPSGQQLVAVYGNGGYQASWTEVHGRQKVLWIDTNGSDPGCDVLDVEPGDAAPGGAAQWARNRLTRQPNAIAIVYTMRSEWQQVKDAIGTLPGPMRDRVRYWIADPTGVPHIVPGSNATQWSWGSNFDISTALPGFSR